MAVKDTRKAREKEYVARIKELEQQVECCMSAMTADAETIRKLKQNTIDPAEKKAYEDRISALGIENDVLRSDIKTLTEGYDQLIAAGIKKNEEVEKQNKVIADLNAGLVTAQQEWSRSKRQLEKGARRWHYLSDDDCKMPKSGDIVMTVSVPVIKLLDQMSDNPFRLDAEFLVRDARYTEGNEIRSERFGPLPSENIVIAWQPLVEPNWKRISEDAMVGIKGLLTDKHRIDEIVKIAHRHGGRAFGEDTRRKLEGGLKVLQKTDFVPAEDRRLNQLIFKKVRKQECVS